MAFTQAGVKKADGQLILDRSRLLEPTMIRLSKFVFASEAKQSIGWCREWIAASLALLAKTIERNAIPR